VVPTVTLPSSLRVEQSSIDCLSIEDEGTHILQNVGNRSPSDKASHTSRPESSICEFIYYKKNIFVKVLSLLRCRWSGIVRCCRGSYVFRVCQSKESSYVEKVGCNCVGFFIHLRYTCLCNTPHLSTQLFFLDH
jgi:hypothetical protein